MGNLKSIYKCLKHINVKSVISDNSKIILDSDGIILPGVGAFGDAMKHLNEKNLVKIIRQIVKDGKPLFGICLGQQLLFSKSYEMGEHKGLNLIPGEVLKFDQTKVVKVPQIGWNSVKFVDKNHFLFKSIPNQSYFYFVHSYYVLPKKKDNILGLTKYGNTEYSSIVSKENIVATQFHPEKSSKYGIRMYENFVEFCKK